MSDTPQDETNSGRFLSFTDVAPLAPNLTADAATILIHDVESEARIEAPCLWADDLPEDKHAAAVGIIRQAVLRWARAGEGGVNSTQANAGSFAFTNTLDTRRGGEGRLYPSELRRLKALCRPSGTSTRRRAFTVSPR